MSSRRRRVAASRAAGRTPTAGSSDRPAVGRREVDRAAVVPSALEPPELRRSLVETLPIHPALVGGPGRVESFRVVDVDPLDVEHSADVAAVAGLR